MSPETVNEINQEAYAYNLWEREQKNRILAMHDTQKKQKVWRNLFPTFERSDDWMFQAKVF